MSADAEMVPVPMLLFCPKCGMQHVDSPQPEKAWTNPPHRSHECQDCGHVWRPADVPTNGVATLTTKGQRDGSPVPPLYSADTIAELRKVIAAADAMRAADHLIGPGGVDACPKGGQRGGRRPRRPAEVTC